MEILERKSGHVRSFDSSPRGSQGGDRKTEGGILTPPHQVVSDHPLDQGKVTPPLAPPEWISGRRARGGGGDPLPCSDLASDQEAVAVSADTIRNRTSPRGKAPVPLAQRWIFSPLPMTQVTVRVFASPSIWIFSPGRHSLVPATSPTPRDPVSRLLVTQRVKRLVWLVWSSLMSCLVVLRGCRGGRSAPVAALALHLPCRSPTLARSPRPPSPCICRAADPLRSGGGVPDRSEPLHRACQDALRQPRRSKQETCQNKKG